MPASDSEKLQHLAEELADANRRMMDYQHQLTEIQNGRVFRNLAFWRVFLMNPVKGVRNLREVPSLVKRVHVPPLPSKLPTASDFLTDAAAAARPWPLSERQELRYPSIKCTVLGDPGWLHPLSFSYAVETTDWQRLLNYGVDMLVVTGSDDPDTALWHKAIATHKKSGVPVVAMDGVDAKWHKDATHLIYRDPAAKPKSRKGVKSLYLAPSINPLVDNPIGWQRESNGQVAIVSETTISPPALEQPTSQITVADDAETYDEVKDYLAAVVDPKGFKTEAAHAQAVLRLLARGVPVATPKTNLLNELLPKYPFAAKPDKLMQTVSDPLEREHFSVTWRRIVIDQHSDRRRFETLLTELKLPVRGPERISIVISTRRPDLIDQALEQFTKQAYPDKELILLLHGDGFDETAIQKKVAKLDYPVQLLSRAADTVFGDNLNLALEMATGEFFGKMDDDDLYGENHLFDLAVAFQYAGADLVGKWGHHVYFQESDKTISFVADRQEAYVRHLPGGTFIGRTGTLRKMRFGFIPRAIDSELHFRLVERGGLIYSTHYFNYIRVRHGDHTYVKADEDFLAHASDKPIDGLASDRCFV